MFFSPLSYTGQTEAEGGRERGSGLCSTINVLFLSSLRVYQEIQEKGDLPANQYVIYLFWMKTDSQSGLQRE